MRLHVRSAVRSLCVAAVLGLGPVASPAAALPIVYIDEWGTGILDVGAGGTVPLTGVLQLDPSLGGLPAVLTYNLPGSPSLVAGDVLLFDPAESLVLDVLRFNSAGTGSAGYPASVLFYSDNLDGFDAPADTPSPPTVPYLNHVTINEIPLGPLPFAVIPSPEGVNGARYTPIVGQPGFVSGFEISYVFISDGQLQRTPVPEPATVTMLAIGGALLVAKRRKRQTRR